MPLLIRKIIDFFILLAVIGSMSSTVYVGMAASANAPADHLSMPAPPLQDGVALPTKNPATPGTDAKAVDHGAGGSSPSTNSLPMDFPPPVVKVAPPTTLTADQGANTLSDDSISVDNMGQPNGLTLGGGQLQSGITFSLPLDQVVITARLYLALKVSPALAVRDTNLRLMLNGQELGSVALNQANTTDNVYELDIPAAMIVSNNNLSFSVDDENTLQCERDSTDKYWVTVLPTSHLQLSSQILDTGRDLSRFPRPFYDPLSMKGSSVAFIFGQNVKSDTVQAASMLASYFGIRSSYRNVDFPVHLDDIPAQNGIVFGEPGEKIAGMTLPNVSGPTLAIIDNPLNSVFKLLLVVGRNDNELRQAAYRLISSPLPTKQEVIEVQNQPIPVRQPYDAPRWIDTTKPVYLKDLAQNTDALTANGLYHDGIRIGFRAAPDLFMWDGQFIPVSIGYRFPTESWIDEDRSLLSVTLNGTFLQNLPVNKQGLVETAWRKLGGDTRQESVTLQLAPYLIYGDNQMAFYFSLKPKANAPCSLLTSSNIKSRIDPDSTIDLSSTHHFTLLPNLSYYIGASFPFSRLADFSQTVILLPSKPQEAEIATLLDMAARAGNATGIPLTQTQVRIGLRDGDMAQLADKDILVFASLKQNQLLQELLPGSPFDMRDGLLTVKEEPLTDKLKGYLSGQFFRQGVEADRYLSSTDSWRGFLSFASPWANNRVVVMATATDSEQLSHLNSDLQQPKINAGVRGDISLINDENGVRSFSVGTQFPRGEMPWYMMIIWYANQHIILLSLCGLAIAILIGSCAYVLLARHATKRLANSANK